MTGSASVAGPRLLAAAEPTLASFYHQPWWLVIIKVLFIFIFLVLVTLFMIWAERRVIGRMQQRPGPNRAGKFGLLQSLMDGIKLALKEDIVPLQVDKLLFWLAPAIAAIPAFISFAIIPFGPEVSIFGVQTPLQLTDLPVAVLLVLAMSSMGVYGIVLAGWSSGSPYPLLGGLRSSAQVISYEIAMGLSFVAVFLYAGSLSTTQIVSAQAGSSSEFHWFGATLHYPSWFAVLLFPSFVIYLITMVGETNRLPFDLPEGEGELVAGFHTEYSSLKFALFYLAEYINMTTVAGLATTLFLGGWRAPWPISVWSGANSGWYPMHLVPDQGRHHPVLFHLAARHAAPDPLRPADAVRLEGADPGLPGLDPGHRHHPGLAHARRQPGRVHRRPAAAGRLAGPAVHGGHRYAAPPGGGRRDRRGRRGGGGQRAGPGGRLGGLPGAAAGPAALPRDRGDRVH